MKEHNEKISGVYLASVVLFMLVLPCVSAGVEYWQGHTAVGIVSIAGKWFVFWGIGARLFTAGLKQVINPAFTAQNIFHLQGKESAVVVKELGFANICISIIALASILIPHWRMAAACAGGLFFGIAGINHIIKKPVSGNEWIALVSDVFIGLVMLTYVCLSVVRYHYH